MEYEMYIKKIEKIIAENKTNLTRAQERIRNQIIAGTAQKRDADWLIEQITPAVECRPRRPRRRSSAPATQRQVNYLRRVSHNDIHFNITKSDASDMIALYRAGETV